MDHWPNCSKSDDSLQKNKAWHLLFLGYLVLLRVGAEAPKLSAPVSAEPKPEWSRQDFSTAAVEIGAEEGGSKPKIVKTHGGEEEK